MAAMAFLIFSPIVTALATKPLIVDFRIFQANITSSCFCSHIVDIPFDEAR